MDPRIEKLRSFRQFLLTQVEGLSPEQLNAVPEGFNNNIIWNIGHLICAQQSMYMRAGQTIRVEDKYFSPFLTGTRPEGFIDSEEIARMKRLFISAVNDLQSDLDKGLFKDYTASPNIRKMFGITLGTVDAALEFLLYHEGVHSGYIFALKRLVS